MANPDGYEKEERSFHVSSLAFLLACSVVGVSSLVLPACGTEGASHVDADGGAAAVPSAPAPPGPSTDGGNAGPVDGPPPPCDASQTTAIQAAFDDEAVVSKDIGAVAIIKDPSCGSRYFTRGASKEVPENALHIVASNTKTYIASLILLLVEEGKLSLAEPVTKWVADVPGGDAVKVHHLLNHTSGVYNYTNDNFFMLGSALKREYEPRELLDIAFKKKPSFAPGEAGKWEYSNTNYVLLGLIIEAVAGKPVQQFLRERILTPIGAKETFFNGYEEVSGEIAYGRSFLGTNGATFMHPSTSWCAGNIVSTMRDLVDWTEKRGNGTFHSAATQAEMLKGVPTTAEDLTWGAGIMMFGETKLNGNGPAIGHGGDLVGYHSYSLYFPKKKATLAVMVHSDKGPDSSFPLGPSYREELYMGVVNAYFGTKPAAPAQ